HPAPSRETRDAPAMLAPRAGGLVKQQARAPRARRHVVDLTVRSVQVPSVHDALLAHAPGPGPSELTGQGSPRIVHRHPVVRLVADPEAPQLVAQPPRHERITAAPLGHRVPAPAPAP